MISWMEGYATGSSFFVPNPPFGVDLASDCIQSARTLSWCIDGAWPRQVKHNAAHGSGIRYRLRWMLLEAKTYTEGSGPGEIHPSMISRPQPGQFRSGFET